MKKEVVILMFLSLSAVGYCSFGQSKSQLVWTSSYKIDFDDFKRPYADRSTEKELGAGKHWALEGYINTGIRFEAEQDQNLTTYNVAAYMEPYESWIKDKSDSLTLTHERAHFDITEIYARKLRKELSIIKNIKVARKRYQIIFRELEIEQKLFDKDHKREQGVSTEWNDKIHYFLDLYKEYEEPIVKCMY
jgi:hypothetical protein